MRPASKPAIHIKQEGSKYKSCFNIDTLSEVFIKNISRSCLGLYHRKSNCGVKFHLSIFKQFKVCDEVGVSKPALHQASGTVSLRTF